ncbi:MAG: hypothetical protein K0R00_665 [Herbinix sp.]|jgi:hypothetical protein|nr:hypothetical protein [Herbinix sp.]
MNGQLVFIMAAALVIVLPITFYLVQKQDKKDKAKNNIGAALSQKQRNQIPLFLYKMLKGNGLTRGYTEQIRRRYEMMYPGEENDITINTVKTVIVTWVICTIVTGIILLTDIDFNNMAVSLLLIYVINTEIVGFMVIQIELKLMDEIAVFVSNVRHNFYINQMVDDAILISIKEVKRYEMKVHAEKIYRIVISSNIKNEIIKYNSSMHNKYLKMFLALCINVMEYSNKSINGVKIFTTNLDNLKKEISSEALKIKKIGYKFSGLTFITIGVCLPLNTIKNYGISMMPELDSFYNGRLGVLYVIATLVIALFIYILNNKLKDMTEPVPKNHSYLKGIEKNFIIKKVLDNYVEKHPSKLDALKHNLKRIGETVSPRQHILQRIILSLSICMVSVTLCNYLHVINRNNITNKVNDLPEKIVSANNLQTQLIKETILKYVDENKDKEVANKEFLLNQINKEGVFYITRINEGIIEEVIKKITLYKNEYFKWYELLICLALSLFAYYVPFLMVIYKLRIMKYSMEDEVNQLNSIIYMLMYNEHITVKDLLEEIELFSVIFKKSIQECINEYNSGEIEALNKLKEKESFGPFIRMVDNFIRCDAMPIYKAFDEIASDRDNYHERRKLENEISIQKRADNAQLLSYIPAVLVIIYLTLPLVMACMKELDTFREMMGNI